MNQEQNFNIKKSTYSVHNNTSYHNNICNVFFNCLPVEYLTTEKTTLRMKI